MTRQGPQIQAMPPRAPLSMPPQDLRCAPQRRAIAPTRRSFGWRLALFGPALIGTALLIYGLYSWLAGSGMTGLEWALLSMIGATFVWVTLSVSTVGLAVAGLLARENARARAPQDVQPLDVALLVPIYNEVPWDVFGNAAAMLEDLSKRKGAHRYTLFVLSDTRDEAIAAHRDGARADDADAVLTVVEAARASVFDRAPGFAVALDARGVLGATPPRRLDADPIARAVTCGSAGDLRFVAGR